MQIDPQKTIDYIINRNYPYEPNFYYTEPSKETTFISRVELNEDDCHEIPCGTLYLKIKDIQEAERGFEYGPDKDLVEIEFHGSLKPNISYNNELALFNKRKKEFAQEHEKWKAECAEIDRKADEKEKKMWERLQSKYSGKING